MNTLQCRVPRRDWSIEPPPPLEPHTPGKQFHNPTIVSIRDSTVCPIDPNFSDADLTFSALMFSLLRGSSPGSTTPSLDCGCSPSTHHPPLDRKRPTARSRQIRRPASWNSPDGSTASHSRLTSTPKSSDSVDERRPTAPRRRSPSRTSPRKTTSRKRFREHEEIEFSTPIPVALRFHKRS